MQQPCFLSPKQEGKVLQMLKKHVTRNGNVNFQNEERSMGMLNPNNNVISLPNLIGKRGVAEILGCSVRQVDYLRKGSLPFIMVGSLVRFDVQRVQEWISRQAVNGGEV